LTLSPPIGSTLAPSSAILCFIIPLASLATYSKEDGITLLETLTFNPLTPELNPSAQRCLARFFTGDFAS
jgi:hypothetical protein